MNICYIFGAGDFEEIPISKDESDTVIAADAGYEYAVKSGLTPDYVIGDFDSLGFVPGGSNVTVLKPEKDFTDMYSAVEKGIELGYKRFVIFGATGGREDHTLANYQLAAQLSRKGCQVILANGEKRVTAVTDGKITFSAQHKGYISVFAHSDVCSGVYEKGLKYELDNAVLQNAFALGVSNEFIGKEAYISVESGTLIIMYSEQKGIEVL